ncbi:MAG: DUF1990 domain-containing protein [Pyrinomonadaceae bacterium]
MFLLTRPDKVFIQTVIDRCADDDLSYKEVGSSTNGSPPGFNTDHNRIQIGNGPDAFEKAKAAIRSWKMFNLGWVELCWPDAPIEVSQNVAVLVNHFGFYSLNACRIVYLIDEVSEIKRFGFAYGTLTEHGETGEERFSVEFHPETSEVWYDLYAFSKPNHPLAKLGYPISRMLQKRFAADSKEAMKRAVAS